MEVARAGGTAGLARDVLERAQRRAAGAPPDEDRERLGAAFASIVKLMRGVSKECEKYYGAMATNMCKENEIQHFCKYHGKSVERKMHSTEGKVDLMDIKTPGLIQAYVGLRAGSHFLWHQGLKVPGNTAKLKLANKAPEDLPKTSTLKFLLAPILSQQFQKTWWNKPT